MAQLLKSKSTQRSSRIDLRATREEERLIRLGAERRGQKLTQFIVRSACNEAEMALADQKHFELPPNKFADFIRALDKPAKTISAVKRLFSQPSVLER